MHLTHLECYESDTLAVAKCYRSAILGHCRAVLLQWLSVLTSWLLLVFCGTDNADIPLEVAKFV